MAKARKEPKAPKFPKSLYVEWDYDPNGPYHFPTCSEQPTADENGTKQVALYKFDRMVTVENKTTIK